MSLHESLLVGMIFISLASSLWKWSKSLLVIISLELISAMVINSIFISGGTMSIFLLFTLVFFVSEALVTLSSLYSSIRSSGTVYKSAVMW